MKTTATSHLCSGFAICAKPIGYAEHGNVNSVRVVRQGFQWAVPLAALPL
jgi:hypothetical protein